jgi:hypothetical protein
MDMEEFDAHLDELTAFHERGETFGFLFDVRQSPAPTAEQRRKIAERIERDLKLYGRACPCAVVVANSLQIGVIKVVLWLLRDPYPIEVFSNVADAEQWLGAQLRTSIRLGASVG